MAVVDNYGIAQAEHPPRISHSLHYNCALQLLLDTGFSTLGREADDDFTTQFLHSPMFDSLREKVNTTIKNNFNSQILETAPFLTH